MSHTPINVGKELMASPPDLVRTATVDDDLTELMDKLDKDVKRARSRTPPTDEDTRRKDTPHPKKKTKTVSFQLPPPPPPETRTTNVDMQETYTTKSGVYIITFQNGYQNKEVKAIIDGCRYMTSLSKYDPVTCSKYGFVRDVDLSLAHMMKDEVTKMEDELDRLSDKEHAKEGGGVETLAAMEAERAQFLQLEADYKKANNEEMQRCYKKLGDDIKRKMAAAFAEADQGGK